MEFPIGHFEFNNENSTLKFCQSQKLFTSWMSTVHHIVLRRFKVGPTRLEKNKEKPIFTHVTKGVADWVQVGSEKVV